MLGELFKFRDLLGLLVLREIRIRYARALLGVAWAVFLPAAVLIVFSALDFGRLLDGDPRFASVPYGLFAFAGVLPWTHFASSLTQSTPSVVNARDIIRKSAFPRETIPLSKVLAGLLDFGIGAVFLAVFCVWSGTPASIALLALPAVLVVQLLLTAGLALLLSAANTFFRDVHYIVQVLLPLGMFATSVVYPVPSREGVVSTLLSLNPMTSILDSYREALLLGEWPWGTLVPGLVGAVVSFLLGAWVFNRLERRFAEEL